MKRPSNDAPVERWQDYADALERALIIARRERDQARDAKHDAASRSQAGMMRAEIAAEHETALREQAELAAAEQIHALNERHREQVEELQREIDRLAGMLGVLGQ